jgi:sugar-phosphatase
MLQFKVAAILFDLDGVLVDSTRAVVEVWTAWAKKNNIEPARVLEVVHGRRTSEVLQLLTPQANINAEAHAIEDFISGDGVRPIPGAAALLAALPDDAWCVVTSGIGSLAQKRLRSAGLPVPRVLIGAEDVVHGKPNPEPYRKGAEKLGVSPSDAIVIEDAPNGIAAGRAAKIKVLGLATTYPPSELALADAVAGSLEQVSVLRVDGKLEITISDR